MIITFRDEVAKALFKKLKSPPYENIKKVALRKLILLDEAKDLRELSQLPPQSFREIKRNRKNL